MNATLNFPTLPLATPASVLPPPVEPPSSDDDELPPVYQFPVARIVRAKLAFVEQYQPLPFPDDDE